MTGEGFNMSLRKFLKTVGVTSQREVEAAVRRAADEGRLPAGQVTATAVLSIPEIGLEHEVTGRIDLSERS